MAEPEPTRLYAGWTVQRWDTPVSDARSLRLVSLLDDGALHLTLEDAGAPDRPRWRITFTAVLGYLNLLEEYRLELWSRRATAERVGWTTRILNSPWLALLRQSESLVEIHHPDAIHYQVGTEDDVVDVCSSAEPVVEALGPAPVESPPAGKSTTLYWSEDREKAERMLGLTAGEGAKRDSRDRDV